VGLARQHAAGPVDTVLAAIQNDLFDLGADLCTPETPDPKYPPLRVTEAQVERLEREIDAMNEKLAPLNSFVLPGGTALAAALHLARTVARRAEREIVRLATHAPVNPAAIRYINRLSDHLFVLSRHANEDGAADVLWVPGKNRN
jgi:cob(I)alamin adenosyltransferase